MTGATATSRTGSANDYDVVVEPGVRVPMRDGITLAADVYRPARGGVAVEEACPVVVERTPYDRTRPDLYLTAMYFASRGYAVVLQDGRGRYDSEGDFHFLFQAHHEGLDGFDTLDWIGRQAWCNGAVGTTGLSFTGTNQQALAIMQPPLLRTQVILDAGYNYWYRTLRHGGAFVEGIMLPYVFWMALGGHEAKADPLVRAGLRQALLDIHDWVRRLPLKRGASPLALAPSYEDWYFEMATRGDYDEFWANPTASLQEHVDRYPDIPVCFVTSWYGHHAWANFEKFRVLRRQNRSPVHLTSGTWIHAFDYMQQTRAGEVEFGNAAATSLDDFRLRWFDRFLKGIENGAGDDPPLRVFVMGGGSGAKTLANRLQHGGQWRAESEWPPPNARPMPWYLHGDGSLAPAEPAADGGSTTYTYDPSDPVPTIGGAFQTPLEGSVTGLLYGGAFDQRGRAELSICRDTLPLASRPDVLVFRSAPLEAAVEVTGPVEVRLWVSTTAADTDFTVKLVDEYPPNEEWPNGFALNLCDSILRLRYRDGRTKAELAEPGETYEITVGPVVVGNLFAPGHRIRLDVASSSFPQFDVNPNTGGPLGIGTGSVVARNTVHHAGPRPSHVVLPIRAAR